MGVSAFRQYVRRCMVAMLIGLLLRPAIAPTAVYAATAIDCQDGGLTATNYWKGHESQLTTAAGASAVVPAMTLSLCNPSPVYEVDGSFYFSNVTPGNGGANDIIQVGFGSNRCPTCVSGTRYVAAYGRWHTTPGCYAMSDKVPTADDYGAYVSAQHDFKVYHIANQWRFYVDLTLIRSIGESAICWSPTKVSWFGETWDSGDQIGGTAASKMQVNQTNYATAEGGSFYLTSWNPSVGCNLGGSLPAAYQCDIYSSSSLRIWTNDR